MALGPKEITAAGVTAGVGKATVPIPKLVIGSILAGAYIGFGALTAIIVSSGVPQEEFGTMDLFLRGLVFSLGLILVVIAGSDLLTGNMALVPLAAFGGEIKVWRLIPNFLIVTIFNFVGAAGVAFFLAVETGVITQALPLDELREIATLKAIDESSYQIFLRALGANWLVCLAVWLALGAKDMSGKILAIIFPILAFVAIGFDHVVANMFFLPAAIFAGVGGIGWGDALHNFAFAWLGNFVGAAVFVAGAYWLIYGERKTKGSGSPGDANLDGPDGHQAQPTRAPAGAGAGPAAR